MDTPLQLTMAVTPAHRNQYLFSDHYLNNLLPQDPRWDAALPEAGAFLAWLQRLYTQEQKQLSKYNESQLEEHWFKPILAQLGHVFEGQASVPGLNAGVNRPDYVFFPDDATRQAAVGAQKTKEYAADALAVGEVKRWDVPLSKKQKGGGASFEAQNPSWQIDYYVRATGLEWGILSNGRLWRLVHKDTSQRLSIHYEVDLVDLLSRGDAGAMRYFTLFFRQAAFRPDAQGRVFLPDALDASMAYAVDLEEDLEANVYQALERLMQGFLDLPANGLGADDLRQIYENSLYLLYRLLFILYGETRGLLPMNRDSYRDNYSLDLIKREIAELKTPPVPMTTIYWGRLKQLFQIINGDNAELNRHLGVPRYNGRLFSPELHPFLEQYAVGDRALTDAIDLLSRRTTAAGREFVDYRTLGVRHLGSIYEGLLEYQPRCATESMVAIRDNKGERWVGEADLERPLGSRKTPRVVDRREAGQVYLETDRGERKATGSYYTPQYIVAYIVENTLGPLVEEATERVREQAKGVKGKAARAAAEQSLIDEILRLKVLDPAMGSGHFLVEATEYLSLALATDPYVETEVSVEEDLLYWKRRVVERCIYGVDKNPLAVELAKLSLWLATVAADKPLSFLDHHLQCGDSLIGARVEDLGEVPLVMLSKKVLGERKARYNAGVRQANLFETRLTEKLPVVMGRILEITEVESKDYDTVRAKEATDQAVRQLKAPFQAVANLWTSAYFGNEFINGEYDEALMQISQPGALMALDAMQRAQTIADVRRFFHWELAFPEVFYDRHGQSLGDKAGFDGVIGNPPYRTKALGRGQQQAEEAELEFLRYRYPLSSEYKVNTFAMFQDKGLRLARDGGWVSMILPKTLLTNHFFKKLRTKLLSDSTFESIVDVEKRVFEQAEIGGNTIPVIRALTPSVETMVTILDLTDDLEFEVSGKVFQSTYAELADNRILLNVSGLGLMQRLKMCSTQLGELAILYNGIKTGNNARFLTTEATGPKHRKVIRGRDINRYHLAWGGIYVFFDKDQLWSNTNSEMFEANPKIVVRQTGDSLVAALDRQAHYTMDTTHLVIPLSYSAKYVLACLNSKLLDWYHQQQVPEEGRSFAEVKIVNLTKLPIRDIDFITPSDKREQLAAQGQALYANSDHAALLRFTNNRLAAAPEQADVVHDLLVYLAEQMITMNKEMHVAVEAFWLDLEGVTEAAAFDVLRNKGKQERTLWKKAEACRTFVREESHSTRRLNESLGWNEEAFKAFVKVLVGRVQGLSDLVGVYRAHSPAYRDLVARIEATDWLIDQIVYKLYDLDEDEIAIVERRND